MRSLVRPTLIGLLAIAASPVARADMAEESLQMPTDGASNGQFPVNPSYLKPKDMRAGVLGLRLHRSSTLDHQPEGGTKIAGSISDDFVGATLGLDLGAGAGVAVEHVEQFHQVASVIDNRNPDKPITEVSKYQQTSAKLVVELTAELRAAIVMRLLQQKTVILGEPFLGAGRTTRYTPQMLGYGCGLTYAVKDMGLGYTYYPPLHGKADIGGQDLIVIEPGFIALDGFLQRGDLTFGILGKHWLVQTDDLAIGSTASDNKTRISYYGLDPDQYIIRTQLLLLGIDYAFTKDMALRLAIGQEQGHFDFRNLLVYDGAGVQQKGEDKIATNRARIAWHGYFKPVELDIGYGTFNRSHTFAGNEGGGTYKTVGQEMSAVVGIHF